MRGALPIQGRYNNVGYEVLTELPSIKISSARLLYFTLHAVSFTLQPPNVCMYVCVETLFYVAPFVVSANKPSRHVVGAGALGRVKQIPRVLPLNEL